MTIQEAIKTGRRFRRKGMSKNRWYVDKGGVLNYHQEPLGEMEESMGCVNFFAVEDLLADDWEIEDIDIVVKESKIKKALEAAFLQPNMSNARTIFFEELNK